MSRPVILSPKDWSRIRDDLHSRYPPSYFIRSKMREKLGFTVREHRDWKINKHYAEEVKYYDQIKEKNPTEWFFTLNPERGSYVDQVHLDFYDERKRTLFLLTYGDMIGDNDDKA